MNSIPLFSSADNRLCTQHTNGAVVSTTIGLVGLPNAGKTTLFNALSTADAPAASYPFCTVDKNVASVLVPDPILDTLNRLLSPEEVVGAHIEIVDIAGLVKGASHGEGLGNKFLDDIRSVDAIFHVVRCFIATHVAHVEGALDPARDIGLVDTELAMADLEVAQRRLGEERRKAKGLPGATSIEVELYSKLESALSSGTMIRDLNLSDIETRNIQPDRFLTAKPHIIVANTDENGISNAANIGEELENVALNRPLILFPAQIETELAQLDETDRSEFIEELGLSRSNVPELIRSGFELLNLITFYTIARNKLRAWRISRGSTAVEGAANIHSDMADGFIRADVFTASDLIELGSVAALRDAGRLRSEGRDYKITDGDVLFIHFK